MIFPRAPLQDLGTQPTYGSTGETTPADPIASTSGAEDTCLLGATADGLAGNLTSGTHEPLTTRVHRRLKVAAVSVLTVLLVALSASLWNGPEPEELVDATIFGSHLPLLGMSVTPETWPTSSFGSCGDDRCCTERARGSVAKNQGSNTWVHDDSWCPESFSASCPDYGCTCTTYNSFSTETYSYTKKMVKDKRGEEELCTCSCKSPDSYADVYVTARAICCPPEGWPQPKVVDLETCDPCPREQCRSTCCSKFAQPGSNNWYRFITIERCSALTGSLKCGWDSYTEKEGSCEYVRDPDQWAYYLKKKECRWNKNCYLPFKPADAE